MKEKWIKLNRETGSSQTLLTRVTTEVQTKSGWKCKHGNRCAIKTAKECGGSLSVPGRVNFNMKSFIKKIKKIHSQKSFGTKQQIFEHICY